MTFAHAQELGDMAFDMVMALTGDGYIAATSYQAVVMRARAEEAGTDLTWLCPCCEKGDAPAGMLCSSCDSDEYDWRDESGMYRDLAHGG